MILIRKIEKTILSRKGGMTSVKIIDILLKTPCNINQIAKIIGMDYNTVKHHVRILTENEILTRENKNYGALYKPTPYLLTNEDKYHDVKETLLIRLKKLKVDLNEFYDN